MKATYIGAILVTASTRVGWPGGGYSLSQRLVDECYRVTLKTDPEPFTWLRSLPICNFNYLDKDLVRY